VHRVAESEPTGGHASLDSRQPTIKIWSAKMVEVKWRLATEYVMPTNETISTGRVGNRVHLAIFIPFELQAKPVASIRRERMIDTRTRYNLTRDQRHCYSR